MMRGRARRSLRTNCLNIRPAKPKTKLARSPPTRRIRDAEIDGRGGNRWNTAHVSTADPDRRAAFRPFFAASIGSDPALS